MSTTIAATTGTAAADDEIETTSGGVEQLRVQLPSNEQLRQMVAGLPDVQVVTDHRTRAADGAIGAGIEITPAGYGAVWLGAYGLPAGAAGDMAWCTQARVYNGAGEASVGSSALDDLALAWADETHADLGNAAVQAAIGYLVHMRHEVPGSMAGGNVVQVKALIDAATPQPIKDLANQLLAEGERNAGPYSPPASTVDEQSLRYGEIHGLGVRAGSGEFAPGATGTVTLTEFVNGQWVPTDKAWFDTNGNRRADPGETNVWTGTSQTTGISLKYVAVRGAGDIRPRAVWTGTKGSRYTFYDMGGARQNVLVLGPRGAGGDPVEHDGPTFRVAADFEVVLASDVAAFHVEPGGAPQDVVHVAVQAGDEWGQLTAGVNVTLTGTNRFFGPFATPPARSADVPADAPVAAEVPFATSGPGDVTVSAPAGLPGGYYVAVPSITRAQQDADVREVLRADATHDFGVPSQTAAVPFQPMATSDITDNAVIDTGEAYVDRLEVFPAPGDVWMQVTAGDPVDVLYEGTAYGAGTVPPTGPQADVPAGIGVLGTATILADGPGSYAAEFPGVHAGQIGTVVWEVVRDRQPAPEWVAGDWSDGYGVEDETFSVRHDTVEVDSDLSVRVTRGGDYLVDDLFQTGFPDDHPNFAGGYGFGPDTGVVEHTAYFFAEDLAVTDDNLTEAVNLGTVTTPAANGYYPSVGSTTWKVRTDAHGQDVPGTYVVISAFAQDDRAAGWASSATDVHEQYVVTREVVALTTTAQADGVLVHGQSAELWDVAHVTGTIPDGATREFALYQWPDATSPTCTPDTLLEQQEPVEVGAAGDVESGRVTVESVALGQYGWVATLRDESGAVIASGRCGEESETLASVPEPLTVTTRASVIVDGERVETGIAGDGGRATDTHLVTGTVLPGYQGRSIAYLDANRDRLWTEDERVWTSEWVQYDEGVAAQAEYEMPEGVRYGDDYGPLSFAQETVDADGDRVWWEAPGSPDQTVTISAGAAQEAAGSAVMALAVTGLSRLGAMFAVAALLTMVGVQAVRTSSKRTKAPTT